MKRTKEDIKGIFRTISEAIKGAFNTDANKPTPEPVKGQQGAFAGITAAYNVTGGNTVYVDISDDNIPGIEANDRVYLDAAETTPYPDGSYTVDGTQFGFSVSLGTVTAVTDAAGTGPGVPLQQAAPPQPAPIPAPQPQPQPQPVPIIPPRFSIQLPKEFAAFANIDKATFESEASYTDMLTLLDKFALGTTEERMTNLETMAKALMMYCFGYKLQDIQAQQAINAYATTLGEFKSQLENKDKQLNTLKDATEKLVNIFEEFTEMTPQADPVTLPSKNRDRFDNEKEKKKDDIRTRIAENLKMMKANS